MRFLVSALGSAGDVHPFIAIGRALMVRGHAVTMLASPPFEDRIRRAALDFVPLGTTADYERVLRKAELWDPRRGARLVIDELLDHLPEALAVTAATARSDDILVGSSLSWATRLVQETRGLAAATVHLSPTLLLSAHGPSRLPGLGDLARLPLWLRRLLLRTADRLVLDRWIAPRLDRIRGGLGLPPVRRVWSRWMHSPDLVIGAWPAWFAPPQSDWPSRMIATGFPVFDEQGDGLDADLSAFLAASPGPIGVTPGSAMAHGERFFARVLDAAAATGRRVVLITPFRDQLPATLPTWARHVAYAPFSALLPRLSLLVHHGGIGTSAQALAAGIPQLVAPFAHDQFDNAARLERLGVAKTLRTDAPVSEWIAALSGSAGSSTLDSAVREAASGMTREEPGATRIARELEALGLARGPRGPVAPTPVR